MKYLTLAIAALITLSACSNAEKCESKSPGSFGSFLDDDWRTYCNEYEAHVTEPLTYELEDLAEFFGNHHAKVDELNQTLEGFEDVKACFDTNTKFLEFRELENCITSGDLQDVRMLNSFSTAIDPWMEELNLTVGDINPKLNKTERDSTRLLTKASEALDYRRKLGKEGVRDHIENIQVLRKKIIRARAKAADYNTFKKSIEPNQALSEKLQEEIQSDYDSNVAKLEKQEERINKMAEAAEIISLIKNTAGKSCPTLRKRYGKETNIAVKSLARYFRKIESGRLRIEGKIKTETKDDEKTQSFSGFACGLRLKKIVDQDLTLCAVHRFKMTREKSGRRWSKWKGEVKEGGKKDGVDCSKTD